MSLTDAQVARVIGTMGGLLTTCRATECGFDAPNQTLEIRNVGNEVENLFTGDFYSGCNANLHPPFIGFWAAQGVYSTLLGIIADARNMDAGDASDSGDAANTSDSGDAADAGSD